MSFFDLDLPSLRNHRAATTPPADFDGFWAETLDDARSHDIGVQLTPLRSGLRTVDVYDVRFAGWRGEPVAAWLLVPAGSSECLPVVVHYAGYGAGRGLAHEHLLWSAAGYAHLVMDTRGQGTSINHTGVTGDLAPATGPHAPGFLTMGLESRENYYYRRLYVDAVRAVDAARALPQADSDRIVVAGMSQGGGLALVAAGLCPGLAAVLSDVPFLCEFRRAATITDAAPYAEIGRYCAAHRDRIDQTFATLDYFDAVFLAARATAPALFSVALMDQTCPPSTVFAAFNAYGGRKDIRVYPFNNHEGGGAFQRRDQLDFLAQILR